MDKKAQIDILNAQRFNHLRNKLKPKELPEVGYERSSVSFNLYVKKDLVVHEETGYLQIFGIDLFQHEYGHSSQDVNIVIEREFYETKNADHWRLKDPLIINVIQEILKVAIELLSKPSFKDNIKVIDNLEEYARSLGIMKIVERKKYDFE